MLITLVGMYAETSPAWVSMIGSAVSDPPECCCLTMAYSLALSLSSSCCSSLLASASYILRATLSSSYSAASWPASHLATRSLSRVS